MRLLETVMKTGAKHRAHKPSKGERLQWTSLKEATESFVVSRDLMTGRFVPASQPKEGSHGKQGKNSLLVP